MSGLPLVGFMPLGDYGVGGSSSVGVIQEVYARQEAGTSISVSWPYSGYDSDDNIWFLVYLDGRLVQRLEGSARQTEIVSMSYAVHEVVVIPWRKDMKIENDLYGSLYAMRGHLEWTRPIDTSLSGYKIYSSASEAGTYELYDTHDLTGLETGYFQMSGDTDLFVSGSYSAIGGHTNTLFTVTITSATSCEITNDSDAEVITANFALGSPFTPIPGVVLVVNDATGEPTGSASFLIGVQPYYDTGILTAGSATYFKVSTVDGAGNESALSSATAITVVGKPNPVANAEFDYSRFESTLYPVIVVTQNDDADVVGFKVYTNYDPSTLSYLDDVIMDVAANDVATTPGATSTVFPAHLPETSATFKAIVRAYNSAGVDDGTTVVISTELPMTADLPEPHTLSYEQLEGGDVLVRWLTNEENPASWLYTVDGVPGANIFSAAPTEAGIYYQYETTIPAASLTPDGTYTVTIAGYEWFFDGSITGPSASLDVVSDSTPPSGISNLTGTPF